MRRILSRRPSPAMTVALLALFVALGGSSYAAVKVGTKQIVNNSVRSGDLRNNDIRTTDLRNNEMRGTDIRNSTIHGRDVARNTLSGDDINESRLGIVPGASNAAALGGVPAGAFMRGAATSGGLQVASPTNAARILELPGVVRLEADCGATQRLRILNLSTTEARVNRTTLVSGAVPTDVSSTGFGPGGEDVVSAPDNVTAIFQIQPAAGGTITTVTATNAGNPGGCAITGQATTSG